MRKIYSKAKTNIIQLGHVDTNTARRALRSIDAVVKEIDEETAGSRGLRSALYRGGEIVHMEEPLRAAIDVEALAALLSSRWFNRLWVMQEAVSAQHNVCYFGDLTFDLMDLLRPCIWMTFKRQSCPSQIRGAIELRICGKLWPYVDREHGTYRKRKGSSVSSALDFDRGLEVTDPRDTVFAVLGLMECGQAGDLPYLLMPDYGKQLLEVYRNATVCAVHEKGIGAMLSRVHQWTEDDIQDESWPSWVPRLDRPRNANMEASSLTDLFAPDSGLQQAAIPPTSTGKADTLSVSGIVAGTVRECTSTFINGSGLTSRQAWLQEAEQVASRIACDRETIAHTVIAGAKAYFHLDELPGDFDIWWSRVFEGAEISQDVRSLPPNASKDDRSAAKFELAFTYAANVRRFFSTCDGKIGLGPSILKASDQVVVLHGGKTPFILRSIESGYKVLGQCYVHGIMQGEAVQEQRSKDNPSVRFDLR
ncbi:hypothetical protein M409DRAFT_17371 [Zasmidium cellare ATCC 36951]|uniref:Heterokaryon incompatibility domain-containing protein n=1 Tax=Zasmidium cellare ATCC 36951 TaxID=1080233 RepID=A0A6A6D104_ZASCE|nr:uncharacterized protein M409DRAFT_17371 [Zasmidium cellare ATCC 36951]KAF2172130.1 hypothetical protein M409DRAFT_17371 [Zasmidium cellare ATCC 36951]